MPMPEPLWTSVELAALMQATSPQPWYADGVQVDSREVVSGDVFLALKGQMQDGHAYVAAALKNGAVAAIVEKEAAVPEVEHGDPRLVEVGDTLAVLHSMASAARKRAPAIVTAVTGSAGKTSVVHALRKCLDRVAPAHASVRSFNNHIGIPLSVARMPRGSRYGIFEVGTNTPGDIAAGSALISPDIAIITTVGAAHIGGFEDEAAIAREKISIITSLAKGGTLILGVDHPYAEMMKAYAEGLGCRVITVSAESNADVTPGLLKEKHDCTCLTADILGTTITFKIGQPGREWVLNSLLILTALHFMEADLGQAALALATIEPEAGRGKSHRLYHKESRGYLTLLDDSYNANTLSVRAALRRLSLVPISGEGRRIAILADMQELGARTQELHLSLAEDLQIFGVDMVFAIGENMALAAEAAGVPFELWQNDEAHACRLWAKVNAGDAIMVKGANSAGLDRLVSHLVEYSQLNIEENSSRLDAVAGW